MATEQRVDVWRVEAIDGRGVYSAGWGHAAVSEDAEWHREKAGEPHPPPWEDAGLSKFWEPWTRGASLPGEWFFGFQTLAQYADWFGTQGRGYLTRVGAWLRRYSVPLSDMRCGTRQVIFLRTNQRLEEDRAPNAITVT